MSTRLLPSVVWCGVFIVRDCARDLRMAYLRRCLRSRRVRLLSVAFCSGSMNLTGAEDVRRAVPWVGHVHRVTDSTGRGNVRRGSGQGSRTKIELSSSLSDAERQKWI